ncbi:hypothetical protein EK904_001772 [Melospiza melodia maxima]|nr:hypothetical protein EK904_001772 [Melospiza melodia maxima]
MATSSKALQSQMYLMLLEFKKTSDNSQRFRETCFAFALTPQQVQQISSSMDISGTKCDFTVQVQLRSCPAGLEHLDGKELISLILADFLASESFL